MSYRMRKVAVAGAAALVAVGGGSAVAAASSSTASSPVYKGCLSQKFALYNVHLNPAKTPVCSKGDTAISWNQTGPAGAQGPKGNTGATGPQGAQGPQGEKGDTGSTGPQGPQGDSGTPGADGAQGPKGDTGAPGAPGAAGAQGPKGDTGPMGPQGPAGPSGASGLSLHEAYAEKVIPPASFTDVSAACPNNEEAISGEFDLDNGALAVSTSTRGVNYVGTKGWTFNIHNSDLLFSHKALVWALCFGQ